MDHEFDLYDAMGMVHCAQINLGNLALVRPGLDQDPYFKIVKFQLDWALWKGGVLGGEEPKLEAGL
jgi:hypothetical protein